MPSPDRHFANAAIFTHSTGLTPNSGDAALYIKSDNKAYVKDSTGTETAIGAGPTGSTGSTDNSILRADGTGGATLQNSDIVIADATTSTQRNVQIYNRHPAATSFAITATASGVNADVIFATGHTFVANDCVVFTSLTGGAGLQLEPTPYFVRDVVAATSFKVALFVGGAAVDITADYSAGSVELANSALVLSPKGTGALIAQKPDGTATGGNARGAHAVDLQMVRSEATQVASGAYSCVVGGIANTASNLFTFVGGGLRNTASGSQNLNPAAVCGGSNNNAAGIGAFIGGGPSNKVDGAYANIVGGGENYSSADFASILGGFFAVANRYAMQAHAAGRFAVLGDAQRARFVLRNKTTTNSAVELFLDGSSARLSVPSGKFLTGTINIAGIKSDGTAAASYIRQFSIKNVSATTTLVGTVNTIGTDEAASTSISITADDTNDSLKVEVTGIASETWRWVAAVDVVEVAYGS